MPLCLLFPFRPKAPISHGLGNASYGVPGCTCCGILLSMIPRALDFQCGYLMFEYITVNTDDS